MIEEAKLAGIIFLLEGDEVRMRYPRDIPPRILEKIRAHREEVKRALRSKPRPPLPAWVVTEENLKAVIPGSPERQEFRRRVIDWAGIAWHACPITIRESILSRHLPAGDYLAAAAEIMNFIGRGT